MSHIFVSYSRADTDCVNRIVRRLQATGFSVWQDVTDIRGGDDWKQKIRVAINGAKAVLLVWSANAKESTWVQWEAEQFAERHASGDLVVIPVNLDGTPVDVALLEKLNYIDMPGCDESALAAVIEALPGELRWNVAAYDPAQSLSDQGAEVIDQTTGLVGLPLVQSQTCRGMVFGPPDTTGAGRDVIQLALQFSRNKGLPFLPEVVATLDHRQQDVFGLYVTGHFDVVGDIYHLNDDNPAQWLEAIYTTEKALNELIGKLGQRPTIQVFCLGPNVLTFALGLKLYRFHNVQLFNYVPRQDNPPHYKPVVDSRLL